jgi:hypothetical protein
VFAIRRKLLQQTARLTIAPFLRVRHYKNGSKMPLRIIDECQIPKGLLSLSGKAGTMAWLGAYRKAG